MTANKLKSAEKASQLDLEISEAELKVAAAKLDFDGLSKILKDELERFEREKAEDVQAGIQGFLESMVVHQEKV